jgi:hypothetical protein
LLFKDSKIRRLKFFVNLNLGICKLVVVSAGMAELGRRKGLKIPRPFGHAGSIPAPGMIK